MKRSSDILLGLYTMGIAALFLAGFLLLVVFGAETYREVETSQTGNNTSRALLSYLSTSLRGSDAAGNISIDLERSSGPILVIGDGSGYALHIYQRDGQLLEEYSAETAKLDRARANVLGETEVFTVERPLENALRITTDAGSVLLVLRSGG